MLTLPCLKLVLPLSLPECCDAIALSASSVAEPAISLLMPRQLVEGGREGGAQPATSVHRTRRLHSCCRMRPPMPPARRQPRWRPSTSCCPPTRPLGRCWLLWRGWGGGWRERRRSGARCSCSRARRRPWWRWVGGLGGCGDGGSDVDLEVWGRRVSEEGPRAVSWCCVGFPCLVRAARCCSRVAEVQYSWIAAAAGREERVGAGAQT